MNAKNRAYLSLQLKLYKLTVTEQQVQQLVDYIELLQHWNRAYNLIADDDTKHIIDRHIIDSLLVLPYIHEKRIVDVGTGAGLPGIPLAILLPDHQFSLLDSNGKKTRFVTQAKITLGLSNVEVINTRAEAFQPESRFDVVISRAFASVTKMLQLTAHLCAPMGEFIALKGVEVQKELEQLPAEFQCKTVERLPFLDKTLNHQIVVVTYKK